MRKEWTRCSTSYLLFIGRCNIAYLEVDGSMIDDEVHNIEHKEMRGL